MKYYIPLNDTIDFQEVSSKKCESWHRENEKAYKLPDYSLLTYMVNYFLQTMYYGGVEEGEEIKPFSIIYIETFVEVKSEGLEMVSFSKSEQFHTYLKMQERYFAIIQSAKENKFLLKV